MIYLIKSDSYNLLNKELDTIIKDSEEISNYSLNLTPLSEIIEDAEHFSLFGSNKTIIVKDAKYFGGTFLYEEDCKKLEALIENMNIDFNLVFICNDIRKDKSITKFIVDHGGKIINIPRLDQPSLISHIKEFASENNITISDSAILKLIDNTGGVYDAKKNPEGSNYDIIIKELEKMSLYDNGYINDEIVDLCSVKLENDSSFDFSNAVIAKDFKKAFALLDKLLNNGVDPIILVSLLASSFTTIYMVKDAVNHNLSDEDITTLYGFSSFRTTIVKRNGKFYTLDELGSIIHNLYELDIKIKTGSNPVYELKEFLLTL